MSAWLGLALAVAAPVLSFIGTLIAVSFMMGGRITAIETTQNAHSKALETLPEVLRGFLTQEMGKGYQAQLDRLERADAECDAKLTAMRHEYDARFERAGAKFDHVESLRNTESNSVATAIAEMRATMAGLREAIDRFANQEQQAHSTPNIMAMLTLAVRAAPLIRQILERPQQRAA